MSWHCCPFDDDVECLIPSPPSPHKPSKRKWCTLDLEDAGRKGRLGRKWHTWNKDEDKTGPRSTVDNVGPRSTGQRDWHQLDIEECVVGNAFVPQRSWQQPDVEDHPAPEAHPAQSRQVTFSTPTLMFLSNLPTKKNLNAYDKNGMDPVRIQGALQGCKCKGPCVQQYNFKEIHHLCQVYHSMHESDRRFMLHTMYTNEAASQAQGPDQHAARPRQK